MRITDGHVGGVRACASLTSWRVSCSGLSLLLWCFAAGPCAPVVDAVLPGNGGRMTGATKSQEPGYQRLVFKDSSPYQYMKVSLELEEESTKPSAVELKYFIITGLKNVFGEVGAALDFDVLKYSEDTLTAFLRVPSRGLVKLWSSLTLLGSYQNQACAFRVLQVSPFLLALTANSRELLLD